MVAGAALAGVVGLGAVGGILANIALTPLTAGASLLQSYWYGSGLILGERMMYTVHWEKIKGRLDKGEDFLQVLDKIMNDDITAIANLSFKAMDETGKLYLDKAGTGLAEFIEKLLQAIVLANPLGLLPGGETDTTEEPGVDTDIHKSIAEIQSWSDNYLKQQHAQFLPKYTKATQAHIKTEYQRRFVNQPTFDKLKDTKPFQELLENQEDTNKEIDKIIKSQPQKKRRAGQSQIQERERLILQISGIAKSIKDDNGRTPGRKKLLMNRLREWQLKLAMLLTRYQF